jgi:hypothetical protein
VRTIAAAVSYEFVEDFLLKNDTIGWICVQQHEARNQQQTCSQLWLRDARIQTSVVEDRTFLKCHLGVPHNELNCESFHVLTHTLKMILLQDRPQALVDTFQSFNVRLVDGIVYKVLHYNQELPSPKFKSMCFAERLIGLCHLFLVKI